jgi:hypothetical protein
MTQRRVCQESFQKGFSAAVSDLALTNGDPDRGLVKPQTIGKTDGALLRFAGAITGTMSVGRITPSVFRGRPSFAIMELSRGECFARST